MARVRTNTKKNCSFYQTDVAYLFALRTIDGRQMWNQSLAQNTRQLVRVVCLCVRVRV